MRTPLLWCIKQCNDISSDYPITAYRYMLVYRSQIEKKIIEKIDVNYEFIEAL